MSILKEAIAKIEDEKKKGKGKGKGKAIIMIQPKESWTHDFCLLSNTEQGKTPSQESLLALKEAGLG